MKRASKWLAVAMGVAGIGACQSTRVGTPIGVVIQDDLRAPQPWRALVEDEQSSFDLGHAVFNTQWSPANNPAGRRDGLGPVFNAPSCDACHNSRRRGRGPRGNGEAPVDLVIQIGRRLTDGSVQRGSDEYGFVLNTAALDGIAPEARVHIEYSYLPYVLPDGSEVNLYTPYYTVTHLSGLALPQDTVLMPRMPPLTQGSGLLEKVPEAHLVALAAKNGGEIAWLDEERARVAGRFGWQATEPTVAAQTASAFAREMGLTTPLTHRIDCGQRDDACNRAANGGAPEVALDLFDALVHFQSLHAVPQRPTKPTLDGERLFGDLGCAGCHQPALPVKLARSSHVIHAYTDLLLHDLGVELTDRDLAGKPVKSKWRTAPLWGLSASVTSGQPLRLLHDGRARSVEEAILWHGGQASAARERYVRVAAKDRQLLLTWIQSL